MCKTILSILLIASLMACEKPATQNFASGAAATLQKITVAYTFQPQSTLVHIAVAQGYFAEQGLQVQAQMHQFGKPALQAVLENQADFATVAETPIMFAILKGEKIAVIANIESSTQNNAVVARVDAGIVHPGELKGKRVAFTPGTTGDFFLDSLLTANGLTRRDITPVELKPAEMQEAILSKKVDALSTWNYPLTQIKRALGKAGVSFYDEQIYTETFNIASRQDFVKKNPETVRRFLRALIKAENFVAKNPQLAQSVLSSAIKVEQELIADVWNSFNYSVVLDQTLLITLEDETRWAIKNKLTAQTVMPDYLSYIHQDSLKEIRPESVKLKP